jgi:hypothetical protein
MAKKVTTTVTCDCCGLAMDAPFSFTLNIPQYTTLYALGEPRRDPCESVTATADFCAKCVGKIAQEALDNLGVNGKGILLRYAKEKVRFE